MTTKISIDTNICKTCKICTEICPNIIYIWENDGILIRKERVNLCFACGQCMAACSEKAIQIEGLSYEKDFFEFSDNGDVFQNLIESRRSIRAYKDKPIPKEELAKIVEAISFSPPSFPPVKIELTVVQDKKFIQQNVPEMVALYEKLMKNLKNPFIRFIIKRKLGISKFNTLIQHLVPLLRAKLPSMKAGIEDAITRNAQALLLFHANKKTENYITDINISLSFAILKAHSLGIGGSAIDLIPPPFNQMKGLKEKFGIPADNEVVAAIILGYPKFKYKRGIKRNLKQVNWIEN